MSEPEELLLLRLALIGIIFIFVLVAAVLMRQGLAARVPATPRPLPRSLPRLVVVAPANTGLAPGTEFPIAGEMTIGRDASNGIVLVDPSVSAQHASLIPSRGGWRLVDHGSLNGTVVAGQWVDGGGVLLSGDEELGLGAVVLRFKPAEEGPSRPGKSRGEFR